MLKRIITLILLTVNLVVLSQKQVTEFKNASEKLNNLSVIENKKTRDVLFLSTDNKNIYGYLFDKDYKLLKQAKIKKDRKYKILLGYKILNNNEYIIYLSNNNLNQFNRIKFSFESGKHESNKFTLLRDYETLLQTVSTNNNFYLISTSKAVNNMYIYTFNFDEKPKRNTIDFSGITFLNHMGKPDRLMNILVNDDPLAQNDPLIKYDERFPSDIKTSIEKKKLYIRKDEILFSLDNYSNETQLLYINLSTLKTTYKSIKKPLQDVKRNKKLSNSYILNNQIYTFSSTAKKAEFNIKNIESDSLLNKAYLSIEDGELRKKGFDKISNLKEAKRFLLHDYTLGINPIKIDSFFSIELVIGSLKNANAPSTNFGNTSPFNNKVSFLEISKDNIFFDSTQHHFDTKAEGYFVYNTTNFLLDSNFKEISNSYTQSITDKINKDFYSKERIWTINKYYRKKDHLEDVIFKSEDSYFFAIYDKKNNSIKIFKYKE